MLERDRARSASTREQIILSSEPYLALLAGSGEPDSSAFLEGEAAEPDIVLQTLQHELRSHFRQVFCLPRSSPFALRLVSLFDRVRIESVFARS